MPARVVTLEEALRWVLDHDDYKEFSFERQSSGGFAIMYKQFSDSEWGYVQ